jgi:hypothetical protein
MAPIRNPFSNPLIDKYQETGGTTIATIKMALLYLACVRLKTNHNPTRLILAAKIEKIIFQCSFLLAKQPNSFRQDSSEVHLDR